MAQLERARDFLFIVCLAAFPLFLLTIRGWTNAFFFLLVLISVTYWRELRASYREKKLDRSTLAVIIALASGTAAVVVSQALRGEFSVRELDGPSRMLFAIPVFLIVRERRINFVNVFQYVCPMSLLLAALLVMHSPSSWRGARIATSFVDPITLGNYALVLGFMSLLSIDILGKDRSSIKLLKLSGLAAGIFLSAWSQSRSGWLAIPFLAALWLVAYRGSISLSGRVVVVAALLIGAIAAYYSIDFLRDRVDTIFQNAIAWWTGKNPEFSVGFRLTMWRIALALFLKRPLEGYGDVGYTSTIYSDPDIAAIAPPAAQLTDYPGPHNEILAGMLQAGVFGLLSKLMLFLVPLAIFFKRLRSGSTHVYAASLLGACLAMGLLICGFFGEQVFYLKFQSAFYGLMIASLCGTALWTGPSETIGQPNAGR